MDERCERTNERTNEWPSTRRVCSVNIRLTVKRAREARANVSATLKIGVATKALGQLEQEEIVGAEEDQVETGGAHLGGKLRR